MRGGHPREFESVSFVIKGVLCVSGITVVTGLLKGVLGAAGPPEAVGSGRQRMGGPHRVERQPAGCSLASWRRPND